MITDKYTKHTVFVLPLIFPELNGSDLKNSSFVNAFAYDLNCNKLGEHIFLAFKIDARNIFTNKILFLLEGNENYNSDYTLTIKKVKYKIVCFNLPESTYLKACIKSIRYGDYQSLLYNTKVSIIKFWNCSIESKVHKFLFDNSQTFTEPICEGIALQDEKDSFDIKVQLTEKPQEN